MITKCLFCAYLHYEVQLNCPKCGSFYTEIMALDELPKVESKTHNGVMKKIKHTLSPSRNRL
jgi:uncharacterized OB-fold protein